MDSLTRIDACWSVSTGLSLIDTIRGRDFQTRHLLLALKAGEPYRVARAMANEAGYASYLGGWPARRRTQRLVDQATALAERTRQPHAIGLARLNAGISAFMEGRWEAGWELGQKCEEILREQCTGVTWELDVVHVYSLRALVFLGRLREMSERLPKFVKEAAERGDLFAATSLQARHSYVLHLMADDPRKARSSLRHAVERWSQQSFYMQHYFRLFTDAEISLYSGSGQAAWKSLLESWPDLERSLLRRAQYFRIESQHLRGRCALAASLGSGLSASDREKLLRSTRYDARRIRREKAPWSDPLARLLVAGVTTLRGKTQDALTELAAAETGFDAAKMMLYAAATKRCRGLLLGGEAGRSLVEAADLWMRGELVRNPERMAAMLAPGRWEAT